MSSLKEAPHKNEADQIATDSPQPLMSAGTAAATMPNVPSIAFGVLGTVSLANIGQLSRLAIRNLARLNHCYVLHHQLCALPATPPRIPGGGILRLLQPADIVRLYEQGCILHVRDKLELFTKLQFYADGFTTCYGMETGDCIAHLQWVVGPEENELIRAKYHRFLLPIGANEILLQNAFTFPAYRCRRVMPYAVWELLHRARESGYERTVAYVQKNEISALNALMGLGFRCTRIVREWTIAGRSWRSF